MTAVPPASRDSPQAPTSQLYSNGDCIKKDGITTRKIFDKAIDQKEKPMEPSEVKVNQKAEQVDTENLSERDYFVQKIMRQKGVSKEVAQSEYDYFFQ